MSTTIRAEGIYRKLQVGDRMPSPGRTGCWEPGSLLPRVCVRRGGIGGPPKVTLVHLRNEDNMMPLVFRLNPRRSGFPSEPEARIQGAPERRGRNIPTIPTTGVTCQNIVSDYIKWRNIRALGSTHENGNESDMEDKELDNRR